MATFSKNFLDNHLKSFAPKDDVEALIDESVKRLNKRTVGVNSLLVVSTGEEQQILAHCDSLNRNTREAIVEVAQTVSYGLVADWSRDEVTLYGKVKFKYAWHWGSTWNSREIYHLSCVSTYIDFIKTISKSLVEDFPALSIGGKGK